MQKNKSTISEQKQKELEAILSKVLAGDKFCLLDEKGKTYSSIEFASFIGNQLIFAEQLYRAFSILKNYPYHHE